MRISKINFKFWMLILISAFCILPACWQGRDLYAMDVDLWSLPQPSQSNIVWKDRRIEINGIDASATHLRSQLELEDAIDFYKDNLLKNGWQIKDYFAEQNIIAFIKGDRFMYVAGKANGKDAPCDVYLVSSPSDLAICRILAKHMQGEIIMQEDATGKDIPDLPRYPASKRMISIFAPDEGAILLYQAMGSPREILNFYQSHLKASGWELVQALKPEFLQTRVPESSDIKVLLYQKGNETLFINANLLSKEATKEASIVVIVKNMLEDFAYPTGGEE